MRHGRRRRDLGDLPWVPIAAIIGVIAVVIIALVFFLGGGFGELSGATTSGGNSAVPQTTLLTNKGVASITVIETTPVSVPATGTFVEVDYIGSYSGTYGANDAVEKVQNSGNRIYAIENASGTISARFQKLDRSTNHEIALQLWKDGKAVKIANNISAYGIVSVQYP
jgi:hypothetical protein